MVWSCKEVKTAERKHLVACAQHSTPAWPDLNGSNRRDAARGLNYILNVALLHLFGVVLWRFTRLEFESGQRPNRCQQNCNNGPFSFYVFHMRLPLGVSC